MSIKEVPGTLFVFPARKKLRYVARRRYSHLQKLRQLIVDNMDCASLSRKGADAVNSSYAMPAQVLGEGVLLFTAEHAPAAIAATRARFPAAR